MLSAYTEICIRFLTSFVVLFITLHEHSYKTEATQLFPLISICKSPETYSEFHRNLQTSSGM